MAQSKRRTKRKGGQGRPRTPAEEPIDGVLVRLVKKSDGDREVTVSALGDTRLTEAPAVLRLAAQGAEKQLGIGGG